MLRSRISPYRIQPGEPKVHRWSTVEENDSIHVRPTTYNAGKSGDDKPVRSNRSSKTQQTPATQVNPDSNGEEREVIIGLDFGTACTKVAIRDDAFSEVYAVPFGELAHRGHPYLLATRIYVDRDGRLSLRDGELEIDDLKVKLLAGADRRLLSSSETNTDASALDVCTGYLALVLQEVLNWFLSTKANVYRNSRLIWQVNIGVPSRSYDNKSELDAFRILAMAAWRVAVGTGPVTIEHSRSAVEKCRLTLGDYKDDVAIVGDERNLHPEDFGAVPEVIAEVVAYARSDLRRKEGTTHLLVDVGASTLDVATFVLDAKGGKDQFSLLTTEVEKLGAFVLHRRRITDIAKHVETTLEKTLGKADGISPLPELASYLPIDQDALMRIDSPFRVQCDHLISKIVRETRLRRNAKAYVWDKDGELPVFVCGGGRRIPVYVEAVESAVKTAARRTHVDLLSLPKPSNLRADELAPDEYDRLAVAYGLSTRLDRIGEVVPPAAIEDIIREVRKTDYRDSYVSKEMV